MAPGKTLGQFITSNFGVPQREQKQMVERISDAVADVAPAVRELIQRLPGFEDTGKRMLATWSEGVSVLRETHAYGLTVWKSNPAFEGISDPPNSRVREESLAARSCWATGASPNLGRRRRETNLFISDAICEFCAELWTHTSRSLV